MGMSPYFARIRGLIGTELLLMPAACVLAWRDDGSLLLVRHVDGGQWGLIGGAIEPDEDPQMAAVREAREEAGVTVEVTGLRQLLGGPAYRLRYSNGDEVAYVTALFDARVVGGMPTADQVETKEVRWISRSELLDLDFNDFARAALEAVGVLPS